MSTMTVTDQAMRTAEQLAVALGERVSPDSLLRYNEPIGRRTTLRVGGPADLYFEPASESDLATVLRFSRENSVPVFILGRGSNLLVRDGGIRGLVICLAHETFRKIECRETQIVCGAGAKLKNVAVEAKRNCMSGIEFLEGIPGTVGGALRMNAGAMGGATFDVITSMRVMDLEGNVREIPAGEVNVSYRNCPMLKEHVALGATFQCTPSAREEIERRMLEYSNRRWESQPAWPSAGCIFKNPATIPAGRLIDELGLKGTRMGGAVVSNEHGNFIVNDGKATARDVLNLMEFLRQRAKSERGIDLHTEVEIVGEEIK